MKRRKKTLYGIPVNENLIWDYDWSEEEYKTEKFFKWYLARVLSNGTAKDLKNIDFKIIKRYLPRIIGVPSFIRNFWQWYLGYKMESLTPLQQDFIRAFSKTELVENFFLTGGTALSAFYLFHRYSDEKIKIFLQRTHHFA